MLITGITPHPASKGETQLRLVDSTVREQVHGQDLHKSAGNKPGELSDADHVTISKLKARDTKVKQHEQAHLSAAAGLNVTPASFTYQKGPNGVSYAVAGEVKIDTSPGHNPEDTLAKAQQIIDAALAPADPSPADRSVAARAQYMAQQARIEMQQQNEGAQNPAQARQAVHAYEDSTLKTSGLDTFA